jgi:hypothetical protein
VRKILNLCVLALVATGCGDAIAASPPTTSDGVLITESPSPYREVVAGPVRAVLPDAWRPHLVSSITDPRQGLVAGPTHDTWNGGRPPLEGYAAMWVDGTRVGVPSDYYYLAATGPALDLITRSERCEPTRSQVFVDHVPSFAPGAATRSPGDFVARGIGTCEVGASAARWAYFVAAPGYGPIRQLGIPASGLYVVVAVVPDSPRAPQQLLRILDATTFAGASVPDMIAAVQPPDIRGTDTAVA